MKHFYILIHFTLKDIIQLEVIIYNLTQNKNNGIILAFGPILHFNCIQQQI